MRRTFLALLVDLAVLEFLLLSIVPAARAQEGPQPPPPFEQVYQMPAVYEVPGMDKVEVRRDIVYKTVDASGGKTVLKLDVYLPARTKKEQVFPGVILISGGGLGDHDWRDAGVYKSYGRMLAASGFVGITFNKRYARGPAGTLDGIEDFHDLVNFVRQHAAELSLDKDQLAFWAFSAGGFLLAPVLNEAAPYSRAVICFYCVSDVEQDAWAGVEGVTDEGRARARAVESSAEQIRKGGHPFPPIFVGRAGWDSPGLNKTIDGFVAEAMAKNTMIEVLNHPTGRHGFDILDANDRSREIIRRALEFLQTCFHGSSARASEILDIHELDRAAHLRGDATDLAARVATQYVSVTDGKITRETREGTREHFTAYFRSRKHTAWNDIEPPLIHISPDGNMAWAIYRVHSKFTETKAGGSPQPAEFVAAWTSTYEKVEGQWVMTSVTSTFEPSR